tara:strand:- start:2383 stop:3084 length:702 start_codon:yes stop_codon:yes gene_type:complete
MIKNSILLCTKNEDKYIKETIISLNDSIPDLEIIVVDDNSSDNTVKIIKSLNSNYNIKLIERFKSKGLGSAFLRAIVESNGSNIGWIDANMSELCSKFPNMIEKLNNYDIVLLSRYIKGGGDERDALRVYSSKFLNFLCRIILDSRIKDYSSSIFIMKRDVLNEVSILGNGHGEFFIEFLYNAIKKSYKILEVPYIQKNDDNQNSKSFPNLFKFFTLGIFYLLRLMIIRIRRH